MLRRATSCPDIKKIGAIANATAGFLQSILAVFYQTQSTRQRDDIERERKKSEILLANMLPQSNAERLKGRDKTISDHFEHASVLFADIVGFTSLSERLSPIQLVELLNEIFSAFDRLAADHGLEKNQNNR